MITVNYVSIDIVKAKTEAIVNSLGIYTDVYGAICRSIVGATTRPGLAEILKEKKGHVKVGDIFETEGFGLPSRKIVHVVSPYRHSDPQGEKIKKAILDIFEYCLASGIKSVTIAPIGAGANGYGRDYSYITIVNTALDFVESHTDSKADLDIYITLFDPNFKEKRSKRRKEERYREPACESPSIPFDEDISTQEQMMQLLREKAIQKEKTIKEAFSSRFYTGETKVPYEKIVDAQNFDTDDIDNLYKYIEAFIEERVWLGGDTARELKRSVNMFVGSYDNVKNGSNILTAYKRRSSLHPSNKLLFFIAMGLDMNRFETYQLFTYHQAALSPLSQEDAFFLKWIRRRDGKMAMGSFQHGQVWNEIYENYKKVLGVDPYKKVVGRKKTKKDDEEDD